MPDLEGQLSEFVLCVQVSGVDLKSASHEEAVSAIKLAPSPVIFIVQSLSATPRVLAHTDAPFSQDEHRKTGGETSTVLLSGSGKCLVLIC